MPELTPISPLLDPYLTGQCITEHHGVCCYPAVHRETDEKYIVKVISIPASSAQTEVLLLTGAVKDEDQALEYYESLARDVQKETEILQDLSRLEGFLSSQDSQCVVTEDCPGYRVYLLTPYRKSLDVIFRHENITHQAAVNMGMDLCAALAACRRAGYLYADLKPDNIFLDEKRGFCIGDLGFISLAGLKYAALPDKYRSRYTAPEMADALAEMSTSLDIYALGLVLYQAYNGGVLPAQLVEPPMYANTEMGLIIMKACAEDPEERWEDPAQMGQALASYLQRNVAPDEPIAPAAAEDEADEILQETQEEEIPLSEDTEDLSELDLAEMDPEDAADMLAQVDELMALVPPAPVVVPEAVDIPMPEPILPEVPAPQPEAEDEAETSEDPVSQEPIPEEPSAAEEAPTPPPVPIVTEETAPQKPPKVKKVKEKKPKQKKNRHVGRWIAAVLCTLLLAFIGYAGYYYYTEEYLLQVDGLTVSGTDTSITVEIQSEIDDVLLSVVCTDSYGNTRTHAVENGQAVIENLNPQTNYALRLDVIGFHQLTGEISETFITASQTHIHSFNATIGQTDGSVILGFTASGPMPESWTIQYSAEGEETKSVDFTGNTLSISGLTVGKRYTFQLIPSRELYIVGQSQLSYTASNILFAQDLTITECRDGFLTVTWNAPEGEAVEFWTVHCYNASGYDETVILSETEYKFKNLTHDTPCTVEVTAVGMTQSVNTTICADPITVWGFPCKTDAGVIELSWNFTGKEPMGGWKLNWSIDGCQQEPIYCQTAAAQIPAFVPGADYEFSLEAVSGAHIFGNIFSMALPEASVFNDGWLTAADIRTAPCTGLVSDEPWTWKDLPDTQFTRVFTTGQSAYLLLTTDGHIQESENSTEIGFVLYSRNGEFVYCSSQVLAWNTMWLEGGCLLSLPPLPEIPGEYVLTLYFNGAFVASEMLTIQ